MRYFSFFVQPLRVFSVLLILKMFVYESSDNEKINSEYPFMHDVLIESQCSTINKQKIG